MQMRGMELVFVRGRPMRRVDFRNVEDEMPQES